MNSEGTVFAQVMALASRLALDHCIPRYARHHGSRGFTCPDRFLTMAFAQLTFRECLCDIEACPAAIPEQFHHSASSLPTQADANVKRNWRIYTDFLRS